ncbi:MAG: polyribonucleotide nucleotidyltransferase [Candidatus Dojkabacteria bacterium]
MNNSTQHEKTIKFNGEDLTFKLGKLAPRAESTVWAQIGGTVVLTIVSKSDQDTGLDYFPLTVEYLEKYYAGGMISGSRFLKRERRPSDEAVIKARQIDHSIRSLFPKGFKKDVNVIVNVIAFDGKNDPETLAVVSASMALMNSTIPFNGPSASVKIGIKGDELIVNPKKTENHEEFDGDFIVSVREDRVLNIEGYGDEISEEMMGKILDTAVEECQPLLKVQEDVAKEFGKDKVEFEEQAAPKELVSLVEDKYEKQLTEALYDREIRSKVQNEIVDEVFEEADDSELSKTTIFEAVDYVLRKIMRKGVLGDDKRTSGRKLDEVRELGIEVGVVPQVHGSALFSRGETQCLSIVTLGSTSKAQILESFEGEEEKFFMHHYNGPRYSLGEAGRFMYFPGRREIGHGSIGENALQKIIPSRETFPYTIRVVSEILSQRGSSSMAASTGTAIALMDAGVKIKRPVAGISVGLVTADDDLSKFKLLTDMEDVEDFYGDMDFKVTGTTDGVTAIQLDNKLMGVPVPILKEAFKSAKQARLEIIDAIKEVIPEPRAELSEFAPKVLVIKIDKKKIGDVIGPGGKVIKAMYEKLNDEVEIDIDDDGQINLTSINKERLEQAKEMIENIVMEPEVDKIYTGVVDKVTNYGAFVDVSPAISGLLHISEMSDGFIKDPSDVVKEGQELRVKLVKIEDGRINFSLKGIAQEKQDS